MASGGLIFLILLAVGLVILGIYTLHRAPTLSFIEGDLAFAISTSDIHRLEHLSLGRTFYLRLPEFFTPTAEASWWHIQEKVYRILRENESVSIDLMGMNGEPRRVQAQVGFLSLSEVIQRTGIIYFAALLYLIRAISVYQGYQSPRGVLLAFFLSAGALYLISSAPVAGRPITLEPLRFKVLIFFVYAAAGGMITLVHFAFVFPEPKMVLRRGPWVPHLLCGLLYGYYGITVVLYSLGITAFGTTFPLFCFLTLVMVSVLSHSLVRQEDRFLRKQIEHSLVAPVLVSLFLLFFQLLPVMFGVPPMSYASFALFSLILPYSLPSALDNIDLYRESLAIEQASQREKEGIRRDFHDRISSGFHHIDALAGKALEQRDPDPESLRKQLEAITRIAIDCSREVTDFLQAIDDDLSTPEDFCAFLRQKGYGWLEPLGIEFELEMSPSLRGQSLASPRLRICLYRVFQEAMTNVIRHAHATMVRVSVRCSREWLMCEITDNGIGFDPAGVEQTQSGLRNMRSRVEELGGLFAPKAAPGEETRITVQLPLQREKIHHL